MKKLHHINKGLIITNIVLGFTIYLGLLFLIPLGVLQIIMTINMIINEKKLNKGISNLLTIYCINTTSVLIVLFFIYTSFIPSNEGLLLAVILISILLAFLHLYITSLINKMLNSQ